MFVGVNTALVTLGGAVAAAELPGLGAGALPPMVTKAVSNTPMFCNIHMFWGNPSGQDVIRKSTAHSSSQE